MTFSKASPALLKKIFRALIISLVLFTVTGFFVLPPIIKSLLIKKLSERLHRTIMIQKVKVNPFMPSLDIKGFSMKERDKPETFLSFEELYINLQTASIFKRGLILGEVRIDKPYINISRNEALSYNFSDLLNEYSAEAKNEDKSEPFRFSAGNIQINDGSIDFWDGPKHTRHTVRNIKTAIPLISNFPYLVDAFVEPVFEAKVNDNLISAKGRTKPFSNSLETSFDLEIKGLNLPYYLAYIPADINFRLLSGILNAKSIITYIQYKEKQPSLGITGDIDFSNIEALDKKGDQMFSSPSLKITIASSDLLSKEAHLSKVFVQSPELHVVREKTGRLNLESIMPDQYAEKSAEEIKEPAQPLLLYIDETEISEGKIAFKDVSLDENVDAGIDNLNLIVKGFSTEKEKNASLSLSCDIGAKGILSSDGAIGINPLAADLALNLKGINIAPFQPYFTDKIRILITEGSINAEGALRLTSPENEGIRAVYTGKASLTKFSSVDKINADDFLKWGSLSLEGMEIGYNPLYMNIKEVSLADFYWRLIVNKDSSLNVGKIFEAEADKAEIYIADESKEKTGFQKEKVKSKAIDIKTVKFDGGTINFSDRYVAPSYSATLAAIGGKVSGISSRDESLASVDLRGRFENYAPLEITGTINPLKEDLYLDLKVDFKDMDLSPLTPYSGKYAGYAIQKGKLSLALRYNIVKKKLEANNNLFIDQFDFGEKVESPDATKLPVKLAVALLRDINGEIKLDLPVSGNLDDPEFHLGSVIIKIIVNILVKAATAPFALLGALFGGGEELSYVIFDPGSFTINEQGAGKLDTLIKALSSRPSLSLEIEGYVDIEKDREGLRQYIFNKKLKAQKLKEMVRKGDQAVSVDEIKIEPAEYEKYLEKAYGSEKFEKPRNFIGMAKKIPAPDMEKLMFANIEVTDDDLRQLASQRALIVKDYMLKSGQIDQRRVFITESSALQHEKKEKLEESRVEFRLK
jgi:hypothetical protein